MIVKTYTTTAQEPSIYTYNCAYHFKSVYGTYKYQTSLNSLYSLECTNVLLSSLGNWTSFRTPLPLHIERKTDYKVKKIIPDYIKPTANKQG